MKKMTEEEYSKFAYREINVLTNLDLNYKLNEALYAILRLIPETKELSSSLLKITNEEIFNAASKALEEETEVEYFKIDE